MFIENHYDRFVQPRRGRILFSALYYKHLNPSEFIKFHVTGLLHNHRMAFLNLYLRDGTCTGRPAGKMVEASH